MCMHYMEYEWILIRMYTTVEWICPHCGRVKRKTGQCASIREIYNTATCQNQIHVYI